MARSSRSVRVLALVAGTMATALVACSLLNGLDADYKLQSTPPGTTPTAEGGKDGEGDSDVPDDARSDAPAVDAGDGSLPTKFCLSVDAGPEGFCWDFEEDPPQVAPGWGWKNSLEVKGAVVVVDGIGQNNSRALRAGISNPGAASGQAFLHHVLDSTTAFTSFRNHEMSFSYAVSKGTKLYTAAIGALGFGTNPNQYVGASIYFVDASPGTIDISTPPGSFTGTSFPVKLDDWRRVTIVIERSADSGPYTSKVSVDGTEVHGGLAFNAGASDAATEVWVGTFFSSLGDGGVEVVIDNVLVRQSH